jgi:hypothetical protein
MSADNSVVVRTCGEGHCRRWSEQLISLTVEGRAGRLGRRVQTLLRLLGSAAAAGLGNPRHTHGRTPKDLGHSKDANEPLNRGEEESIPTYSCKQ